MQQGKKALFWTLRNYMQNFILQWNAINFIVMQLIFIAKMAQKYQKQKNSAKNYKKGAAKNSFEFFRS